jgi:hypothetical protein
LHPDSVRRIPHSGTGLFQKRQSTSVFGINSLDIKLLGLPVRSHASGSKRKVAERRSGKAKTGEKAELTLVNEHFESVFNAA